MVEYLSGGRIQGSSTSTSDPPQTSWKVVGRLSPITSTSTKLSCTFTAKDNIQVLASYARESGASADPKWRLGVSSADTGSDYASRFAHAGETYTISTEEDNFQNWCTGTGDKATNFEHLIMSNPSGEDKLGQMHSSLSQSDSASAGSSNKLYRLENSIKWADTNQAGYVEIDGNSGTTFSIGSEIIVLGCDDNESDSGTNFWQRLDSGSPLTSNASSITVNIAKKRYLWIDAVFTSASLGGCSATFNDNTSNYSIAESKNNNADTYNPAQSNTDNFFYVSGSGMNRLTMFISNIEGKNKMWYSECQAERGDSDYPDQKEMGGKWCDHDEQIEKIVFTASSGNFGVGSFVRVYGGE